MDETCSAFARGDFSSWTDAFTQAGFQVHHPCTGVIQICAAELHTERLRLIISVGVHGDETMPIEMVALLLKELSETPQLLAVDLMIAIGNLPAIAAEKRFIDADLNRLFTPHRTLLNHTSEAQRADQLMHATAQFFHGHPNKCHLDLHATIRASVYPTFAIVPGIVQPHFVDWLGTAGIAAVVLNPQPSVTFSSYTCMHYGAVSCTAELGCIGKLGKNDLSQFTASQDAIAALLRSGEMTVQGQQFSPAIFCITQELIKRSDAFQFTFDKSIQNFTEFAPSTVLATDGQLTYSVGATPEYVLFPNSDVQIGLRAGLTIARVFSI